MLNEKDIITNLKLSFPEYIGDDAAIIPQEGEQTYVITKDLLIEDVHFRSSYFDSLSLARKALHVNLSDIAAMGARSQFVMLGISIPLTLENYANEFLAAFTQECLAESVILIGGDTTKSPDKLCISVTAIGVVDKKYVKLRKTAKAGDLICAIGNLGHAHIGLLALENGISKLENFKNHYLRPKAKTTEGLWLGKQSSVTAMMDISDGLYIDLKRLSEASQIQANIELTHLYFSPEFQQACQLIGLDPQETSLTGGEDYGLLFCVNPEYFEQLNTQFYQEFNENICVLGEMSKGEGLKFAQMGQEINLSLNPFSHFGES